MCIRIEIEQLSKLFVPRAGTAVKALDNLSLSVQAGQIVGLVGSNGSGKTTLLKILSGLIAPSTGRAVLNGYDSVRQRDQARQQVGAVLKPTSGVRLGHSLWDNLARVVRGHGHDGADEYVSQLLDDMSMAHQRDVAVGHLSLGEQQKVAITCALIGDPPIVLLDEPAATMDLAAIHELPRWATRLAHAQGKTVVIATRWPDVVREWCDRVVVLREGQVIVDHDLHSLRQACAGGSYHIRIKGHLDQRWFDWFEDMTLSLEPDGSTLLSGAVVDQTALHGLLAKVRDLGLPLLGVTRGDLYETPSVGPSNPAQHPSLRGKNKVNNG